MPWLFGFHAVQARLRHAPASIRRVYVDAKRRDGRMQTMLENLAAGGVAVEAVAVERLQQLCSGHRHQGVVAEVETIKSVAGLEDLLAQDLPDLLLLVMDGVTDPHNLGACLRVADGAGAHAVIVPRDRSVGLTPVVAKVACGAADTVPLIAVTNLARTLAEIADAGVTVLGTAGEADTSIYAVDAAGSVAWVIGAEGSGLRRLTRERYDRLVNIPMAGAVESLNASVASALCLYETVRQRQAKSST